MIKVLITEDSSVVRGYLKHILDSDPEIQVVGVATNGEEAVKMVNTAKPDVITMDIHMPKMDGFEATRQIMETHPVPIVICSASWNPEEVDKTFRTMEAGAVAALEKPRGFGHPDSENSVRELVQTVKLMAGVKVVRRWARLRGAKATPEPISRKSVKIAKSDLSFKLVAIGASTGGPLVLQTVLSGLSSDFPVPILIVQHIAPGFLSGLAEWLSRTTNISVHIAKDGDKLKPGNAYLAPDGLQMGVDKYSHIVLEKNTKGYNLCPSVSYLFHSVAQSIKNEAIVLLLTGMGKDGAQELKMLKDIGCITIAQDEESSVVHGMPGEAIKLGGATYVLPADKISEKLKTFSEKSINKTIKKI
jgi:two-component system chemotaxis response regulator CheB